MIAPQPEIVPPVVPSTGLLLAQLGHGAMKLYRDCLIGTGLKPPHVETLMRLRVEPIGQQALGEATGVDPVKLVGILNDLETAGLVERRRDAVDRRRHNVAITCEGRARLDAVERASEVAEERLLASLSPAQREELAALLRLVAATSRVTEVCPGTAEAEAESIDCEDSADLGDGARGAA